MRLAPVYAFAFVAVAAGQPFVFERSKFSADLSEAAKRAAISSAGFTFSFNTAGVSLQLL